MHGDNDLSPPRLVIRVSLISDLPRTDKSVMEGTPTYSDTLLAQYEYVYCRARRATLLSYLQHRWKILYVAQECGVCRPRRHRRTGLVKSSCRPFLMRDRFWFGTPPAFFDVQIRLTFYSSATTSTHVEILLLPILNKRSFRVQGSGTYDLAFPWTQLRTVFAQ